MKKVVFGLFFFAIICYGCNNSEKPLLVELVETKNIPLHNLIESTVQDSKTPILYFSADWCRPCLRFRKSLRNELVGDALKDTRLIRVDVDTDPLGLAVTFGVQSIPTFIKLDENGNTIARITSAAWDDDVPENIAPVMTELIGGKYDD